MFKNKKPDLKIGECGLFPYSAYCKGIAFYHPGFIRRHRNFTDSVPFYGSRGLYHRQGISPLPEDYLKYR